MVPSDCGLLTLLSGLSVLTLLIFPSGEMAAAGSATWAATWAGVRAGAGAGAAGEGGGRPSGLPASELDSSSSRRKAAGGLRRVSPSDVGRKSMAPSAERKSEG